MPSEASSEVSELSISDTESFADIHEMSPPTSPTPASAAPESVTAETGASAPSVVQTIPAECKHPKYYFDDGLAVFLVGGFRYCLHQYLFTRDSPYFASIFAHRSSSEALDLADKKSSDFDAFLSILYSTSYRSPSITSVDDWSAVLRLATEWSFNGIRGLAIKRLGPIASSIEKIVLGYSLSIPEWLPAAYVSLCRRPHPLTAAEIRMIQAEDAELVMSVRETIFRARLPLEASEISARVADAMKSATKTAAFIPPDLIPGVTNMVESSSVEAAIEDARVQDLPSEVHLQLDTPTLLSLISDNDGDIVRLISTQIPRSIVHAEAMTLLDELTPANVDSTAHTLAQWMNLAKEESDFATMTQVIDLIFTKATSDWESTRACAILSEQLSHKVSTKIQACRVWKGDTFTVNGRILFYERFGDKCKTEIENIRSKIESAASSLEISGTSNDDVVNALSVAHEHERAIVRFIGELVVANRLYPCTAGQYLNRLIPDGKDATPTEQQIQLICVYMSIAGEHSYKGIFGIPEHMDRYISLVKAVDTSIVSPQTAAMMKELLRMQRNGRSVAT